MSFSRVYTVTAIILKRTNVGEADRILTLFTKQYGKLRVIAKGIRKITSRRASHLDLFSESQLTLHKGKTWDIVTEVTTIHARRDKLGSWMKMRAAYLVVEVIDKLLPDNEPQRSLYEKLEHTLELIGVTKEDDVEKVVIQFFNDILVDLGYKIRDKVLSTMETIIPYIEHITERKIRTSSLLR